MGRRVRGETIRDQHEIFDRSGRIMPGRIMLCSDSIFLVFQDRGQCQVFVPENRDRIGMGRLGDARISRWLFPADQHRR
jgi:hypothetical protein